MRGTGGRRRGSAIVRPRGTDLPAAGRRRRLALHAGRLDRVVGHARINIGARGLWRSDARHYRMVNKEEFGRRPLAWRL